MITGEMDSFPLKPCCALLISILFFGFAWDDFDIEELYILNV